MGKRKGKVKTFDLCRCVRVTGHTTGVKLHWNILMAQTFVYQIRVRPIDGSCMH